MKNSVVTIVTLTYKKFDTIFKTIDSVLCQDYPYIEYIIADDGSNNFDFQIVQNYIDKKKKNNIVKFSILVNDKNIGTVKNANKAYLHSQGEILIPLSCGDTFPDSSFVTSISKLFIDKNINVLSVARKVVDVDGTVLAVEPNKWEIKKINKLDGISKKLEAFLISEFYHMIAGCSLYIRKSFFIRMNLFDESFVLWEDLPFIVKVLENGEDIYSDYSFFIYYEDGGISTRKGGGNPLMKIDVKNFHQLYFNKYKDTLGFFSRRKLEAIVKREGIKNKFNLLLHYLLYIDVYMYKTFFRIKLKINKVRV